MGKRWFAVGQCKPEQTPNYAGQFKDQLEEVLLSVDQPWLSLQRSVSTAKNPFCVFFFHLAGWVSLSAWVSTRVASGYADIGRNWSSFIVNSFFLELYRAPYFLGVLPSAWTWPFYLNEN